MFNLENKLCEPSQGKIATANTAGYRHVSPVAFRQDVFSDHIPLKLELMDSHSAVMPPVITAHIGTNIPTI